MPPCSVNCRLPAPALAPRHEPLFVALCERASTRGLTRPHSDQEGRMNNPRRKQRLVVGMLVGALAIGLPPSRVHAFSAGPAKFAGVATMTPADGGGITVTFPSLPNGWMAGTGTDWATCTTALSCPYVVVMGEASNASGYQAGTPDCTYFNVLHKVRTQFEVQHKKCSDGSIVSTTGNVQLNWAVFRCVANAVGACQ